MKIQFLNLQNLKQAIRQHREKTTYSCGIKIAGTIFLSLQQNLCKAPSTVIMTDLQKLNFSVSVTQSILNFEISVSCTECN
jgi:hypothetical protein